MVDQFGMGTGKVHSVRSRKQCFSKVSLGHPLFPKDVSFISFRPVAGGAMAPVSCKLSKKMLNPRGLDKHEELFKFVPVKAGSQFKFMPFHG